MTSGGNCMTTHQELQQLIDLGRFEVALTSAHRSLAENPADALTHYYCACALVGLERKTDAAVAIERAIALDPTVPDFFVIRGGLDALARRFKKAESELEHALSLDPNKLSTMIGYVDVLLDERRVGNKTERIAKALPVAEAAIATHPDNDESLALSATVELARKHYQKAEAAIDGALKLNPESPTAHQLRGQLHEAQGDFASAGDAYVTVGKLDPTSPDAHNRLLRLGPMKVRTARLLALAFGLLVIFGDAPSWIQERGIGNHVKLIGLAGIVTMQILYWRATRQLNREAKRIRDDILKRSS